MHGRPRRAPTATESAASAAKSVKLEDLQAQLLDNHHNKQYTKEAILASRKLLEVNPEVYTAWNFRKLALQHNLDGVTDPEAVKTLVDDELRTVELALRVNPKSYGAWYHRKWVLNRGLSEIDFDREFRLLDQLLKSDPRNFHGWNYRRFVAKLKNVSEVEELKFTMDMINTNFSNYSSWHNRSALLCQLLKKKAEGFDTKGRVLTEEYDLVRQALFTDPSDQSGWFYHLWLLDQTVTLDNPLFISSWPPSESDWVLSTRRNSQSFILFPSSISDQQYSLYTGTLPIILYFNQAVSGVNSSTVTVSSIFTKDEDLVWCPLSITKSKEALCWVTYLKICDAKYSNTESLTVEISIAHSYGILSSSGHSLLPSQFKFTITTKSTFSEQAEGEPFEELVTWNDDNKGFVQGSFNEVPLDKLNISKELVPKSLKWNLDTLANEIDLFRELSEENCKFVKLTLARLLIAQDALMSHENLLLQRTHSREVIKLFDDLITLDPSHARYYEDERSIVTMNQATFCSSIKCSTQFGELYPSGPRLAGLRLSRLSLTRVGCVEHLLWVQVLDLSYNELRSIAGLEALQHLICLNLSNNRISSFTALEPLKLLASLKVLNISSNEIGSHPVDTSRYLCSSPLSHTKHVELIIKAFEKDSIKVGDYWEPLLLFNELNLTQLDISGNTVVDETFRGLLKKALPTLRWLDGEHIR